jgi:uncharacterized protein (TIGR02466 family)
VELQHIFTTPIATDYLDLDNKSLEQFCKQAVAKELIPNNQSNFVDLQEPALADLIDATLVRANSLWRSLGLYHGSELVIDRAWANTDNTSATDVIHCHPGSVFAAVYYVKGAGSISGDLIVHTPVIPLIHYITGSLVETPNVFNSTHWSIPPVTGKLVIIPGWLMHCVSKNNSGDDRISIAMDIRMAKKS